MRVLSFILTNFFIGFILFWLWLNYPEIRSWSQNFIEGGDCQVLEIRHSADSIITNNRQILIKDEDHSFLEPKLIFHPYLLMEIKYSRSYDKTGEGFILWSLIDGEMILDTTSWEKTHGFRDCILAGADKNDFKIINTLSSRTLISKETLKKSLRVDTKTLDRWLKTCKKKNLIVQKGNCYRLHLPNPKLRTIPVTKLEQWLITTYPKNLPHLPPKFRESQIVKVAKDAFSNDFAILKTSKIFLPVYYLTTRGPDNIQTTSCWNAVNGKKLPPIYHGE